MRTVSQAAPVDTAIPFTYKDGRAVFGVENLTMFAMYRIEW